MKHKKAKLFILIALTAYTAIMIYLMFFHNRRTFNAYLYNLKPFKTIREAFDIYIWYVKNIPKIAGNEFWRFAVNIFGNIGMFVPFGIFLTILFDFKFIKPLIIFETGLVTLETAQLISRRGVFDIDDIILNTIGFLIGCAIITLIYKFIIKVRRTKQNVKIQNIR